MPENVLDNTLGGSSLGKENAPTRLPSAPQGLVQREPPQAKPAKLPLEEHWGTWKQAPTPQNMGRLLTEAKPIIDSAITSYTGGNKLLTGHAKALAMGAFKTYDPKAGAKLQTHLMTQMQPLIRLQGTHSTAVKVPERIRADLYHMRQEERKFTDDIGREPSDQELADRTGLSMKRLGHVRKFARSEVPESGLTSTTEEGEEETFYPGTETNDPEKIWKEYVHHDLAPIDQKILEWKDGFNGAKILSTNEIARRLKITPGAVSQRAAKIAKLLAQGSEVMQ